MGISIGRIVIYRLNADDVERITTRRKDARDVAPSFSVLPIGNQVFEGDGFPLLVVKVWNQGNAFECVNGQVFLDGNDTHWITSAREGTEPGQWSWPVKV